MQPVTLLVVQPAVPLMAPSTAQRLHAVDAIADRVADDAAGNRSDRSAGWRHRCRRSGCSTAVNSAADGINGNAVGYTADGIVNGAADTTADLGAADGMIASAADNVAEIAVPLSAQPTARLWTPLSTQSTAQLTVLSPTGAGAMRPPSGSARPL